jgi:hypothetical protein
VNAAVRRKLVINIVPLLDVLAIMIFGIYLQSQMLLAKRRANVDPEIERRERYINDLKKDLNEQTQRRSQSESALRQRDALNEALEGSLGLAGKNSRHAINSLPTDPKEREALLEELNKHRGTKPKDLPAVTIFLTAEPGNPIDVARRSGSALGRITGARSAIDVELRLYEVLAPTADKFTFVMVGWDNVEFGLRRTFEAGAAAAIKRLGNRPGAGGQYYTVTLGYQPGGPEK